MRPSTQLFRAAGIAILTGLISAFPAAAQSATTDPVGFVTVNTQGNADSYTYIPFKRTPEYAGALVTPNGVAGSVVTVAGSPNFTATQFVYAQGTQPKTYYVLFTSGPKIGMYYTVSANTSNTLTLDTAGDDISGVSGATVQVIPYDTIGSVFPSGQGVNASSSFLASQRQTEILIPNNVGAGTNLAAGKSYFYFTSASDPAQNGWRQSGQNARIANDDILLPDTGFIVRHNVANAPAITFMGTVHMGTLSTPVGTVAPNTTQDNAVALPVAANLTLAQTKLVESGAFAVSNSFLAGQRKDELLIWDNTIPGVVFGKNNAAFKSYFYYVDPADPNNANLLNGWRQSGQNGRVANADVVLTPTTSLVIRKKSTGAPSTVLWTVKPPYVP